MRRLYEHKEIAINFKGIDKPKNSALYTILTIIVLIPLPMVLAVLINSKTTMFVLVLFCAWKWTGVNMIYFLSGLNAIPQEQYEAADIDGVNTWQKFWHITVPNLRNVTVYVVTISVYGGFAMFGESYTMFGSAASPGDIGLTMVSYIYLEGFNYARLGMGSAIGVALFAIIMIVNVIQLFATGTFKKENN